MREPWDAGSQIRCHAENDRLANVHFFGSTSGKQTGQLHQPIFQEEEKFEYEDGEIVTYRNLLLFGKSSGSNWRTVSAKGDSGAVVFDDNYRAIGLLIGGNDQFSYALPIKPLLDQAECSIKL